MGSLLASYGIVSHLRILVVEASLLEVLAGNNTVVHQLTHAFVFFLRLFIIMLSPGSDISFGERVGGKREDSLSLPNRRPVDKRELAEGYDTGDSCHQGRFIPLGSQDTAAGLDDLGERSRFHHLGLQADGLRVGFLEADFVAVLVGGFVFMSMLGVVVIVCLMFMVVFRQFMFFMLVVMVVRGRIACTTGQ